MIFEGKVWKFGDNISTDLMMPGSEVHTRSDISAEEAARKYCMLNNRPGWASTVQKGDIIVAGRNFGCGSSRPAVILVKALGISIVIVDSISRLFFRNAIKNGFPVLICEGVSALFEEGDVVRVNVETGEVKNLTKDKAIWGEPLPPNSPPAEILKAGGLEAYLDTVRVQDLSPGS
ncbi:MAG: 3-isopropylmalate dehydratase [Candidatus Latescibacterota bacterium]